MDQQMFPPLPHFIILFTTIVFISATQVNALGIGSTISISYGTSNIICGIMAGNTTTQSIQCYTQGETIPISPSNVSFHLISGGHDIFCGLTTTGSTLYCWDTNPTTTTTSTFQATTLYDDETAPLSNLSVGDSQICVLDGKTGGVHCWYRSEEEEPSKHSSLRPPDERVKFEMITSGHGFSCGIVDDDKRVSCWGDKEIADSIETQFDETSMMSLVAGKSHVCGLSISGELLCKGTGQLNYAPRKKSDPFRFSSLALGENNTCAIERNNGSVVCWGGKDDGDDQTEDGSSFMDIVVASFSFGAIVAGMDFNCGLTKDLSLICWGPGWPTTSSFSMTEIPLPKVIPGPCVQDKECGTCGVHPNSSSLCSGINSNICRACETPTPSPLPNLTPPEANSPQPPSSVDKPTKAANSVHSLHWAYLAFGSFGTVIGLSALLYFIIRSRRRKSIIRQKKSKSLNSTGSNVPLTNSPAVSVIEPGSYPSTAQNSRSSSITYSVSLVPRRNLSLSNHPPSRAEKFSFDALASATENFSGDNIIGSGSFGTVYRGRLSDGRPVAIKREEMLSERKMMMMKSLAENDISISTAFDSELELLSRLHHKHLVGLVGYCQENEERLLVYEYMANGTLHDHLFTDKGNSNTATTTLDSWKSRIKIALDAARGIEYLHNYAVPPIIHRDIKSSNILLDSNWIGRVSDFGLSLMMMTPLLQDQDDSSSSSSLSTTAVGTVGYIDPEYYVLKVLTTKSDVYGFGVVLLEILTGKKAVFRSEGGGHGEPEGLVEYAGPYINGGEVWKVLDKRVGYPLLNEAEAVDLVSQTALRCVSLEGKDRPMMSDVVANLEKAFILCKENHGGSLSRASSMAASFK